MTIEEMVLEIPIGVHGVIKITTKTLQLMRTIKIRLYLSLIESVWFLKVDPPNIATITKVLPILYFRNLFDSFYPEVVLVELYFLIIYFLSEVYTLPLIEDVFKEGTLVRFVKDFEWWTIKELLHDIAFILFLKYVFVYSPVF